MSAKLFLIPTSLGESPISSVIPSSNNAIIESIKHFIVEDIRSARRFLKKVNKQIDIDSLNFYELNKHTTAENIEFFLKPVIQGYDMGIMSEAGCPGIADPGADIVKIAHERNICVVPLVGPSSIILSLMASGFNGQNFAFNGYLPIQESDRIKALKQLEKRIVNEQQTQIFIETPYRNTKLMSDIIQHCNGNLKLCIAADITLETEFIKTLKISDWKKKSIDLNKRPCIFLMYL